MNIHEYQAKLLLGRYGVPVTDFYLVSSVSELDDIVDGQQLNEAILKVQIHAGGRGKAGGVKFARSSQEIKDFGRKMLGMKIVNNQTGPYGVVAHQLIITPPVDIKRELYLSVVIDRQHAKVMMIASTQGGMDIEEVAAKDPKALLKFQVTDSGEIHSYNLLHLVNFMGWKGDLAAQGQEVAKALAKAFVETDASLIEINPLVETNDGQILALDAKLSVDDNALYRQPELGGYYDPTQDRPEEVQARKQDLAYVALEGDIGCMVNGAGLAMATMDIIHLHGGNPANFLDVGGGASQDKIAEGFNIILSDSKVKAILVNIFGGIMNCETLSAGIVASAAQHKILVPIVIRMEGTNVEQGKKILKESGLHVTFANDLDDAAQKAVAAAASTAARGK